ncbi:rhodanese-like domain-containing protein [Paludisphaera rhizosphaerae]|uniref:rhodanese-like domain-containing protein n=1 Tax=Paludisphaera rhizosphaerae TaxID=2711216 RepID=UPI00197EB805|nr:rhodanese-like domain-containing protein [Paludisphaera rhizosphaerae]
MNTPSGSSVRTITPQRLHDLLQAAGEIELIDVRTPAEFRSAHAPIAQSTPLGSFDPKALIAGRRLPGEPLYVMCRSGARSSKACAALAAAGTGVDVVNVEGGLLAWEKAGLPVERGRFALPLDRQVRIVIGALVILGVTLGYLVDPWFNWLSGLCGAGLVFAGITDFCPLATMMAKMPWNQAPVDATACQRP